MKKKTPLSDPGTGKAIAIWVPASCILLLDAAAQKLGVTRSAATREIIINFLTSKTNETPAA